jgi:hypothetical protein
MFFARHLARSHIITLFGLLAMGGIVVAAGCSADRALEPSDGEVELASSAQSDLDVLGQPIPLDFATYENSHQVVHPSAVAFPSAWHGQRFWLALTPYPNSDSKVENPSLYGSATGDEWAVPAGVTNPVATTGRGYLSDPDLIYDETHDELRLYYREVVEVHRKGKTHHKADVVYLTRSSDGQQWSTPVGILNDMGHYVVSPTVSRRSASDWSMWSVDAGTRGCASKDNHIIVRHSQDGVSWSRSSRVSFEQPGYLPWHLDVQYVPQFGAYWALVAAYPYGRDCTSSSLFLATSPEGTNWTTYPSPVLARGVLRQFSANVYRSTFAIGENANDLTIWLTGAALVQKGHRGSAPVLRWSAAVWHTHPEPLLAHVRMTRQTPILADSEPSFLRQMAISNALP